MIRGVVANGVGQIVIIGTQLISTPILLSRWGAETLGLWILFSSLPAYLAIGDLGLAASAGTKMTMLVATREVGAARAVYQSAWLTVTACSIVLTMLGLGVAILAPDSVLPSDAYLSHASTRWTIVFLTAYGAACLQTAVQQAGFRAIGAYPAGTLVNAVCMLAEAAASIAVVLLGGGIPHVACALLVVRCLAIAFSAAWLFRRAAWLKPGFRAATSREVKELLHLGLFTMLVPAGYALNLQGVILVIGWTLGPAPVAVFSVTRTLTRTGIQACGLVNHAIMPEFAVASARRDRPALERLFALNVVVYTAMLAIAFLGLVVVGSWFIALWTRHSISVDHVFMSVMALAMVLHGTWLGMGNLLLSINRQSVYAPGFVVVSAVLLLLCHVGGRASGLDGIAVSLCCGEIAMMIIVARAIRHLGVSGSVVTQVPMLLAEYAFALRRRTASPTTPLRRDAECKAEKV